MRLFGRVPKRERAAMMARLHELAKDPTLDRTMIRDCFILYARVGRDRKKLGMEWAVKAERSARESQAFADSWKHA